MVGKLVDDAHDDVGPHIEIRDERSGVVGQEESARLTRATFSGASPTRRSMSLVKRPAP